MQDRKLVQTNISGFLKDPDTNVVINTNESEYLQYREQVQRFREMSTVKEEVQTLRTELAEIKDMLKAVVQMVGK